jgi:hypothetical protein
MLWESLKVILRGVVPEVRNVDGSLRIARTVCKPGEWHPPAALYHQSGPRVSTDEIVEV